MRNIFTLAVALLASVAMNVKAEDAVLYSADFSTYEAFTAAPTSNDSVFDLSQGERVFVKKNKTISCDENGLNFNGQNVAKNHCIAIPVSGVNGKITITITDGYTSAKSKYKYAIVAGTEINSSSISSFTDTKQQASSSDVTASTEVTVDGENCIVFLGEASSSYTTFKSVVITTPGEGVPVVDPVTKIEITGPTECFVGQKITMKATPDVKATSIWWTDIYGTTLSETATLELTPDTEGSFTYTAWAENANNTSPVTAEHIVVVTAKEELQQVTVDAATVWDWTKAGTGSIEWKENTTPRKDIDTVLLANVEGINNNAEFNSQALLFAGQYPIRDGKCCQGPWISFKTTVPGFVQVEFSNTGTKDEARYVAVNGVVNTEFGTKNTTAVRSANIAVEAGDIVIQGSFEEFTEPQYLRIYKITFSTEATPDVPVPPTDLALHEPGTYEETSAKGGYDAQLSVVDHREYEVYYGSYDSESNLSVTTEPQTKAEGITTSIDQTSFQAKDNWFKGAAKGGKSDYTFSEQDEFSFAGKGALHKMLNGDVYEFHIKGYDQFSIIGKDNNADASKGKHLEVYVDTVLQTMTLATEPTLRRFDISSKEHVIRVKAIHDGDSKSELYCFSLRVAQVPTVKYLRGNDSTQVVLQTADLPRPVYYYTKYNNSFGGTRVVWEREEAYGIELSVKGSDEIGDTLMLSGKAMCAVGEYPFHVESYDLNGNVIKSLPSGKFTVASDIRAVGEPEVTVYQNEEMEKLEFLYHALSADEITLDWSPKKPAGITGSGENGKYYISGTPTEVGDFSFTISVKDGNSIEGSVSVKEAIIGDNLALYLYTNKDADTKDGVKALLESKGYKFVPRIAKREGLRPAEDYKKYSWVMISEDANADNLEVLALTKESAILPVLNMKAFSYANERLSWGDPDNGTVKVPDALSITVQRDDHPIFQALHKSKGDKIQVLDTLLSKGLMPIDINLPGTFCLATALTRSREYYDESGEPQTFLHEVPAGMRGGKKYICLPIAISSSNKLTKEGEQLIEEVVKYLLSDEQSGLTPPQLQIESFIIDDIAGKIDQSANKISFEIDLSEHKDLIKEAIVPEVVITSDYTHVTPASGDTIDFSDSWSFPVPYEVSDYINRRVYEVSIRFFSSEGIEDVYAAGDWVHIYDIFGRQVSTTNEDVYHMVLPRGIYIVVTETGEAFKIMR